MRCFGRRKRPQRPQSECSGISQKADKQLNELSKHTGILYSKNLELAPKGPLLNLPEPSPPLPLPTSWRWCTGATSTAAASSTCPPTSSTRSARKTDMEGASRRTTVRSTARPRGSTGSPSAAPASASGTGSTSTSTERGTWYCFDERCKCLDHDLNIFFTFRPSTTATSTTLPSTRWAGRRPSPSGCPPETGCSSRPTASTSTPASPSSSSCSYSNS